MQKPLLTIVSLLLCWPLAALAEDKVDLLRGLNVAAEAQVSTSDGTTPLWLNANKYGVSSLSQNNGYLRVMAQRDTSNDSLRRWRWGYGADITAAYNHPANFFVHQAYAEVAWKSLLLTVGSKEQSMNLKNDTLSSGSQTLGINAQPIPTVRISMPNYVPVPFFRHWLHFRFHLEYGRTTDGNWQEDYVADGQNYNHSVNYHSKSGFLKIGKEGSRVPLSFEIGLETATQYGGTSNVRQDGTVTTRRGETGLKAMWHAFFPGGKDENDGKYNNAAGNFLGSWLARLNYETKTWAVHLYADHFFEDDSQMFFVDYDGFGEGDAWNKKDNWNMFVYDMSDMMLGLELNLKRGTWLRNVVIEHLSTKYQSGPIYHDHSYNISDHIGGQDDYYNHGFYVSWSHWGQVMGNPLYRSPLYNTDGALDVQNSRFTAWYGAINGRPLPALEYLLRMSYQNSWGRYKYPYTHQKHQWSMMIEGTWHASPLWHITAAVGFDRGSIVGDNNGLQCTVRRIIR